MIILNHICTPKLAIGVYEVFDTTGKQTSIDDADIDIAIGSNAQRPEIFKKRNTLIVVYPNANDTYNISIKGYTGTIQYTQNKVQQLTLGKDLIMR
jgi:hypothetical protein